ncbi:MAG: hypothetical protein IJ593_06960, partial [Lachnospiraceae bacterium]|nr:hypothetical protein [Lachnospiraceae bacterium]
MKRIDLTGKTFGDLKVTGYAGDRKWFCRCSCGKELTVDGGSLRKGIAHSCGHDNPKAFKDMTGEKFGEWEVLEYSEYGYWKCKCSCGNIKNVAGWHLRKGLTKSCGHDKTGFANYEYNKDREVQRVKTDDIEVGDTVGKWTILEDVDAKNFKCKCSCGNVRIISKYNLKIGKSTSCGECSFEDLTGRQFGEWTVIRYADNSKWVCKCSCGEIREVWKQDLINGRSKCCGCKNASILTEEMLSALIVDFTIANNRKPTVDDIAKITGYSKIYIKYLIKQYNIDAVDIKYSTSSYEYEIIDFIESINQNIAIEQSNRTVLKDDDCTLEIDIYLPEYKLGIEVNGDYWHSTKYVDKYYHKIKTDKCEKLGIRLIHVFEHEWNNETLRNKIKDLIKDILTDRESVYARKCKVDNISNDDYTEFLNKYHLHNSANSEIKIGLT